MPTKKTWLVTLATAGGAVGAVVALGSVPPAASGSTSKVNLGLAAEHPGASPDGASVAALTAEAQRLQKTIAGLETQIATAGPGSTEAPVTWPAPSSTAGNLRGEEAQLQAEKQQLDAESASLAQAKSGLSSEQSQLSAYEAALQAEAQKLSNEEKQFESEQQTNPTSAPATTPTTPTTPTTSTTSTAPVPSQSMTTTPPNPTYGGGDGHTGGFDN